ncbi:MAG: bifunctional 4-hydroxy-3-methylbut-2-enyl diphosphate reductase/30S ribosomal protein S1 [Clostridiales Family XIII bacterium]|jgi:4-hydroxy-3-methylbut-2-enyl diphosphate reductase|nr:bifunctional 4-hydroxy-3-methylbut-2-enyl diphosphate reductase/30S ribosomal protein S1 [Clostridiales Family XIII bacterium]
MEIIKAEEFGFCSGVRNAVEVARSAVVRGGSEGKPVYAIGPIIHNRQVGMELSDLGLVTVGSISDIPDGAVLVVRSHGEGPDAFAAARERGIEVADATCLKVRRTQRMAADASEEGRTVIIVGDASHPEVRGIAAWAGGSAVTVGTPAEAEGLASQIGGLPSGSAIVLAQTTMDEGLFREIAEVLEAAGATVHNTICSATKNRQRAAKELAKRVDAMVVVGDKTSSNSQKLHEISLRECKNSYFIATKADLPLKNIKNCNKIGITAGASTPEQTIEEVIIGMSENMNGTAETNPMHEFMEEIDKSLRLPRNGDVITGEVIQITDKYVIVNIGCKKDGLIPRNEVNLEQDQELSDVFAEGDEVQAKVLKTDDGEGNILLSKKRAVVSEHWEDINKALDDRETLDVEVIKAVNGGVIASFNEINGFIPMSQLSERYVETADEFIGKPLTVKVMRVDPKRHKVVFSHKAVINEERQKRMMEVWDTIHVGDIIDGKVMRFTEYGAFVDIGGVDGLLHISEISWGKLEHPSEVLKIDQEIKVKVLSMSKEREKISLGYKQNLPEPWSIIKNKYQIGQIISGKAVQIKEYGVFVEIEPGLDGLVHISEIAYKRVNNIEDELTVGQDITAKILDIDQDRRRISLSIKEATERPVQESEPVHEEVDETRVPAGVPTSSVGSEYSSTIGDRVKEALAKAAEEAAAAEAAAEAPAVEEAAVEEAVAEPVAEEAAAEETAPVEEAAAAEAPAVEEAAAKETAPVEEAAAVEAPAAEEAAPAEAPEAAAEEAAPVEEAAEGESSEE